MFYFPFGRVLVKHRIKKSEQILGSRMPKKGAAAPPVPKKCIFCFKKNSGFFALLKQNPFFLNRSRPAERGNRETLRFRTTDKLMNHANYDGMNVCIII